MIGVNLAYLVLGQKNLKCLENQHRLFLPFPFKNFSHLKDLVLFYLNHATYKIS
jgi:hypothetical protein